MKRLFIANRGEICRRIAMTAKILGIETVALTDRKAPPGFLAGIVTEFVNVPEETPALYLDPERMVAHARQSGCDALHPGFGFLSENAAFAALCEKAGLIWIGPSSESIAAMASKAGARDLAKAAGVPIIEGLQGFDPSTPAGLETLQNFAARAGYPLLVKAAMGGGGKGMRLVENATGLKEAVTRASSEALSSFGDGTLIVERYLTEPRHVEVQVFGDRSGQVVAVGDRDCSVQRRHQKIIEEAPAPLLHATTRAQMHAAAVRLAQEVGYYSAGTVEFLLDWSEKARQQPEQPFFFLEMNTRLQVEHPVTEEVCGLDLVEWQLRVARGEKLSPAFAIATPLDPKTPQHMNRHSMEVRLYAEDATNQFFPSPGPVHAFIPADGPGIRWEIGLDPVDEVTGRFDPMVAKLVATGNTREGAMARLGEALERTVFAGPPSNLELLREIVVGSPFRKGPVSTHFIVEQLPSLLQSIAQRRAQIEPEASVLLARLEAGELQLEGHEHSHSGLLDAVNRTAQIFSGKPASNARAAAEQSVRLSYETRWAGYTATTTSLRGARIGRGEARTGSGKWRPFWYVVVKGKGRRDYCIGVEGTLFQIARERQVLAAARLSENVAASSELRAPVPGKVVAVHIKAGDKVEAGQALFILESMKMEFEVKAPRPGQIASIHAAAGGQVVAGGLLAKWAQPDKGSQQP